MKFRALFLSAVLVAAMLMMSLTVFAQDDVESLLPEDLTGVSVQTATEADFILDDSVEAGDTFILTMYDVAETTSWQFLLPTIDGGRFSTNVMSLAWAAFEEGLQATAILENPDYVIGLTLSNPFYDSAEGTLSYTAQVVDFRSSDIEIELKDMDELPDLLLEPTLFIVMDAEFVAGINTGRDNLGVRGPGSGSSCSYPRC